MKNIFKASEVEKSFALDIEFEDGLKKHCKVMEVFKNEKGTYIAVHPVNTGKIFIYAYKELADYKIEISNITSEMEYLIAKESYEGMVVEGGER